MRPEFIAWINANTWTILTIVFLVLSALLQTLLRLRGTNIFRIVILAGTFSLAFAFAGNDLVNFVDVPLAAYDSWASWNVSGVAADLYTMEALKKAVQTPTIFLLLAATVMVLTLCFSRKAHRVIQTSINLSSSTQGEQKLFGSSLPARVVVRPALRFGSVVSQIIPSGVMKAIDRRMDTSVQDKSQSQLPFDYVRASINLVVSAILIARATSLKLPLSTTCVTFMVAMGSSFADGAWDQESAVYRISGVLTVVSGWFVTAISAFTLCLCVSLMVFGFGEIMAILFLVLALFLLIRTNFLKKGAEKSSVELVRAEDRTSIARTLNDARRTNLNRSVKLFREGFTAFLDEDEKTVTSARKEAVTLFDDISRCRGEYCRMAMRGERGRVDDDVRHCYCRAFTNMKEVGHELRNVLSTAEGHLANKHRVFRGELRRNLLDILNDFGALTSTLDVFTSAGGLGDPQELTARTGEIAARINRYQLVLLQHIEEDRLSLRSSELYLSQLQFARDFISRYTIVAVIQRELNLACADSTASASAA